MGEDPDRFDSVADFYDKEVSPGSDPLAHALLRWDENEYQSLQERDIELYLLICHQLGFEPDVYLGRGTVKLVHGPHRLELTWNGDDEDLLDLVLEGAEILHHQK